MNNLKYRLSKLETEFVCDESTTNGVDILIYKELNVEQKEYYPSKTFVFKDMKESARILEEFYFCMEETLNRIIYFAYKNKSCENLLKLLIRKRNNASIRRYITNNIMLDLNQI
ncbi:hypothetical protein GLOIN_2v1786619 [Rhizophagus clarus]|uniref:Uncharacterized protein n=1 Tax=Rhizophagus clarus TaxID=94130 RepID=A0A8H3LT55_9GLOM|nr:hypothetical protein GLOIN_2v1786619 [Rhizophagus clarus]